MVRRDCSNMREGGRWRLMYFGVPGMEVPLVWM